MVEPLTTRQKELVEQIYLDPATFSAEWAHTPFNTFWRTNNFIQRSMSYLFALDSSVTPSRWQALEVDNQGRLEIASIAGAVSNNMYGYDGAAWRNLLVQSAANNNLRVTLYNGANLILDAAARAGYVYVTDGTNTMPTMDVVARRGYVQLTDGTDTVSMVDVGAANTGIGVGLFDAAGNRMPTLDAVGRAGYFYVTDGTNTMPTMDAVGRAGYTYITDGTNTMPTMDATARRGYVQITDGTDDALVDGAGNLMVSLGAAIPAGANNIGDIDVLTTVQPVGFGAIADNRRIVTTAGTRVTLVASSTAAKHVFITAETGNTGIIVVGGSTCVAALATRQGTPLNAGDTMDLPIADLVDVYLDSTVNGDGVTITYLT